MMSLSQRCSFVWAAVLALGLASCKGGTNGQSATALDPPVEPDPPGDVPAFPFVDHLEQSSITAGDVQFEELFVFGDELFEAEFNALDGVGVARLPDGCDLPARFSRVPPGCGRPTGPNGQACGGCHNSPLPTSAGEAASNVLQDPARQGLPPFNTRNATHLFGSAILQRLAEEMTEDLHAIREGALASAITGGETISRSIASKGVSFGTLRVRITSDGTVVWDLSQVEGVDPDLVVRPYGWKGDVPTLRAFCRGAADRELGMQPEEITLKLGDDDPDGDGVTTEFSVGDVTSLVVYVGAQPVPKRAGELAEAGLAEPPSAELAASARRGEALFGTIGCASCHRTSLTLADIQFDEPTSRGRGAYFDEELGDLDSEFDPDRPFSFDLSRDGDQPRLSSGSSEFAIELFGDLKRHNMGASLADAQATPVETANGDQLTTSLASLPTSVEVDGDGRVSIEEQFFLTAELWGVGNTGPWLHDGRAASLDEAIALHGVDDPPAVGDLARSEAQESRDAFLALSSGERADVVQFLKSLVLFRVEGGEE
ncbi:MAG: di-heme oxidoredictase family protein [Planctomycetota bacterium]